MYLLKIHNMLCFSIMGISIYIIKKYRLHKWSKCACIHEEVLQAYSCLNLKKNDLFIEFISILYYFILKLMFCYINSYTNVTIA